MVLALEATYPRLIPTLTHGRLPEAAFALIAESERQALHSAAVTAKRTRRLPCRGPKDIARTVTLAAPVFGLLPATTLLTNCDGSLAASTEDEVS
mmetsp:Transcript_13635/g.31471  ORF Transcript_13635/g.31471 Transcript_13635/m.31471 type:complete len:95 (-) Transcript_13635:124-408(-)